MNNKGFVFMETIVTVVVLTTTLVLLYSSYSNVVLAEQKRLYHDNIAYVYKTKHIRDVLDLTLDYNKFNAAVDYKLNNAPENERMYIYVFNIESDIYTDNTFITSVQSLYNFYRLIYLRIEDIGAIKDCVKEGDSSTNQKCKNTLSFAKAYGYSYLEDYLLTLDVPTDSGENSYKGHEGILISLIYEAKNGDVIYDSNNIINVGTGKYSECLTNKVGSHYNVSPPYEGDEMIEAFNWYNNAPALSFNMYCSNAYYISWVYL